MGLCCVDLCASALFALECVACQCGPQLASSEWSLWDYCNRRRRKGSVCVCGEGKFTLYNLSVFWVHLHSTNYQTTCPSPTEAASFPTLLLTYGALVLQRWEIGALVHWPHAPREGFRGQRWTPGLAGGQGPGPSPGVAYLRPLILSVSLDHREREWERRRNASFFFFFLREE